MVLCRCARINGTSSYNTQVVRSKEASKGCSEEKSCFYWQTGCSWPRNSGKSSVRLNEGHTYQKEMTTLCARKTGSILRQSSLQAVTKFSWDVLAERVVHSPEGVCWCQTQRAPEIGNIQEPRVQGHETREVITWPVHSIIFTPMLWRTELTWQASVIRKWSLISRRSVSTISYIQSGERVMWGFQHSIYSYAEENTCLTLPSLDREWSDIYGTSFTVRCRRSRK